jgi:hypothetical protein
MATLVACGPKQPAQSGSSKSTCDAGLEAGENRLVAPPLIGPLTSRVSVELSVSRGRIQSEIGRRVPDTLDRGRRNIGAPGRVSYVVTRGPLSIDLRNDRLVTTTRIRAQVDVCKELGPFCVTYGHCTPSLLATASVPVLPGPDYSLGPTEVSVTVEQGCSIAGYDATPEVERLARQQATFARQRIDSSLPRMRPQIEQAWSALVEPWPLEGVGCLLVRPEALRLARPRLEEGQLTTRIGLDAEVGLYPTCPARAQASTALPPLVVAEHVAPESHLELAVRLSWAEVGDLLSKKLASVGDDPRRILELRARPALIDGHARLAIGLRRLGGHCENTWLLAEPWFGSAQGEVRFRVLQALSGPEEGSADLTELRRLVEERARFPLPVAPARIRELVSSLPARLDTERPDRTSLDLGLEDPAVGRVVPDRDGLVAVVSLRGRIALRAE